MYLAYKLLIDANITIPDNYIAIYKDGNKKNCVLSNLELVNKHEHIGKINSKK